MKSELLKAIIFIFVFAAASLFFSGLFGGSPTRVIGSESSVGTWVSGVLLTMSATAAIVLALRSKNIWWYLIASFFLLLAADERFMFHEKAKHFLLFNFHEFGLPRIFFESPVIIAAALGAYVSYLLCKRLTYRGRTLVIIATAFGLCSVAMDVVSVGILAEEICKMIAEISIAAALITELA